MPNPLSELGKVQAKRDALEKRVAELVAAARLDDASWQEIGNALGISRQAAWERYDRKGYERELVTRATKV